MSSTLSRPPQTESSIRRVAILFAGGPAPAANAVISTAAVSFLRNNIDVIGVKYGYSRLGEYGPDHPMEEGRDYIRITHNVLKRTRNSQGIIIGTARANPGKKVSEPAHLEDPERTAPLKTVYDAMVSIGVDALISIGGDDTLKTANKFKLFQEQLPEGSQRIPVVHLPKTIDNDYMGIDFTFGYFTAVEFLAGEIRNLLADSEAAQSYFVAETMGRSAGWLAYGAANDYWQDNVDLDLSDLDYADNLDFQDVDLGDLDTDYGFDVGGVDMAEDLDVGDIGIGTDSYDLGGFDDFGGFDGAGDVDVNDFGGGYMGDDDFGDFGGGGDFDFGGGDDFDF